MIYIKILAALSLLSFLLIVLSVVVPGWFVYTMVIPPHFIDIYEDKTILVEGSSGIWYKKECKSDVEKSVERNCTVVSYHAEKDWSTDKELTLIGVSVIELEVETTIALIGVLVATILIFAYGGDENRKKFATISAIILFGGGTILAFAIGRLAYANANYQGIYEIEIRIGLPYSLFIAGVGLLICFVVFVILVIIMNMKLNGRTHQNLPQSDNSEDQLRSFNDNRDPPPSYSKVVGFQDHQAPPPAYANVVNDQM